MKKNLVLTAVAIAAILIGSCNKEKDELSSTVKKSDIASNLNSKTLTKSLSPPCGTPQVRNLIEWQNINVGTVSVWNTKDSLFIDYEITAAGWRLSTANVFAGDCGALQLPPYLNSGIAAPDKFPYHSPEINNTGYLFKIPLAALSNCICISAQATVQYFDGEVYHSETSWASGLAFSVSDFGAYFNYCKQQCAPPAPCTGFNTVTQGGWGAPAHGNNPGTYLNAHFASCFPNGLTVGCGNTDAFSSAADIRAALPQGGPPAALTASYVNPVNRFNVLLGQVVALKLNVTFDGCDAGFATTTRNLGNQLITTGAFAGKTVNFLLAEAEKVLGGCASGYSVNDVNTAATSVNQNYDSGANGTYLTCPY